MVPNTNAFHPSLPLRTLFPLPSPGPPRLESSNAKLARTSTRVLTRAPFISLGRQRGATWDACRETPVPISVVASLADSRSKSAGGTPSRAKNTPRRNLGEEAAGRQVGAATTPLWYQGTHRSVFEPPFPGCPVRDIVTVLRVRIRKA